MWHLNINFHFCVCVCVWYNWIESHLAAKGSFWRLKQCCDNERGTFLGHPMKQIVLNAIHQCFAKCNIYKNKYTMLIGVHLMTSPCAYGHTCLDQTWYKSARNEMYHHIVISCALSKFGKQLVNGLPCFLTHEKKADIKCFEQTIILN